jgi:glycosyltransferase involved in cell wall biosynthesis
MRVGIIHPNGPCKGGGERLCCYLAKYLTKKGHEVTVFSDHHELAYPEIFSNVKPKVQMPKIDLKFMNSNAFKIYKQWIYPLLFDYSKVDLLIDTLGSSLIQANFNKKLKIFYFHYPLVKRFLKPSSRLRQDLLYYYPKDFFDLVALKAGGGVKYACNSMYIQNLIELYHKIRPEIIRPPVDTDYFVPAKKPTEDFVLLTGRITRFKKFELALRYLKNEKVTLAGQLADISYYNELRADFPFIQFKTNLTDKEMKSLYQNCKTYIFTNWEEHFGIVPFEAMSCERRVIVPERCGASELIEDNKNGYIVKRDFSNFEEKYQCQTNYDTSIGKSARQTVLKNLAIDVMGKGFEKLIE